MLNFKGLDSLIKGVLGKEINEWVYSNINQVNIDPFNAQYYIFPQEEIWDMEESQIYDNEDGATLPIEFKDKNLQEWLEVTMIEDVIDFLKQDNKDPSLSLIANSLQYYFENDAFME